MTHSFNPIGTRDAICIVLHENIARELPEDQSHITLLAAEYDMGKHFSIKLLPSNRAHLLSNATTFFITTLPYRPNNELSWFAI